jgi:hypothetical protein
MTWPRPGKTRKPNQFEEEVTMTNKALSLLVLGVLILPGWAGAASQEDFQVRTTEQLLNLCTAPPTDPLYPQAVAFCRGFLVGAYKYYEAEHLGPKAVRFVCLPNPPPSRSDAIAMFIEWAKAHPQYWKEAPVETEFRFLMEKWPCNQ